VGLAFAEPTVTAKIQRFLLAFKKLAAGSSAAGPHRN
jgi:hypothetical protein